MKLDSLAERSYKWNRDYDNASTFAPDAQTINQLLVFMDVSHTKQMKIHFLSGLKYFDFSHYLLKNNSW